MLAVVMLTKYQFPQSRRQCLIGLLQLPVGAEKHQYGLVALVTAFQIAGNTQCMLRIVGISFAKGGLKTDAAIVKGRLNLQQALSLAGIQGQAFAKEGKSIQSLQRGTDHDNGMEGIDHSLLELLANPERIGADGKGLLLGLKFNPSRQACSEPFIGGEQLLKLNKTL